MMPFLRHSPSVRAGAAFSRYGRTSAGGSPWRHIGVGPRLFATTTKSKRSRRRKSLTVSDATTTATTKDRLRMVIDKNRIQKGGLPTRSQAEDVLNLATNRVTWVKDKIFEFWGAPADDAGAKSSAAAKVVASNRPVKKDINMDARWWIWNILFALLPALGIGVYCEFRGQKMMHEYYTGLESEQMKRILGEDAVMDELIVPPPENFVVRIARFGREITAMLLSGMSGVVSGGGNDGAHDEYASKSPHRVDDSTKQQLAVEQPTTIRTPATAAKTANDLAVPGQDAPPASSSADSYKDDLVHRIEHLESLLLKQERERQRQIKYQVERLQQSGTQNRMEDDLIQKWKHQAGETPGVLGQDAQQSAAATAPTNRQAREQQHQQPLPTGTTGAGNDEADNVTSGWSSLLNVKKVAEATFRQAAEQIMPLLGETGKNGAQDKHEPTKQDPAADETSSTFRSVHSNESSIRGQTDNDTSVPGHVHAVPQDVVARPGSSDTEGGTDRKEHKWWQLW